MTLVEVLLASFLSVLLIACIFSTLINAERGACVAAQQVAAFGRSRELLEQMRGAPYAYVTASNYPPETLTLTHLGGTLRVPLLGTRSNTIAYVANPAGKSITVTTHWTFQGQPQQRSVHATIYRKE